MKRIALAIHALGDRTEERLGRTSIEDLLAELDAEGVLTLHPRCPVCEAPGIESGAGPGAYECAICDHIGLFRRDEPQAKPKAREVP